MFAPVISLFAIVGVAMVCFPNDFLRCAGSVCNRVHVLFFHVLPKVGGYVLGIFVPPGEGAMPRLKGCIWLRFYVARAIT